MRARRHAGDRRVQAHSTSRRTSTTSSSWAMTRTRSTPSARSHARSTSGVAAPVVTRASAMSSASGFQRSRPVSARTDGKAARRACTRGATTGKIAMPDRRQRRAVSSHVTGVPSRRSRTRALARSFSCLSSMSSMGPRAASARRTLSTSGSRGAPRRSATICSSVRWSQLPTRNQAAPPANRRWRRWARAAARTDLPLPPPPTSARRPSLPLVSAASSVASSARPST